MRLAELKKQLAPRGKSLADANAALGPFDDYVNKLGGRSAARLSDIASPLGDTATGTRDRRSRDVEDKKAEKQLYLDSGKPELAAKVAWTEVDLNAAVQPMRDALPALRQANDKFRADLHGHAGTSRSRRSDETMKLKLLHRAAMIRLLIDVVPHYQHKLDDWSPTRPLPWYAGITDFFFSGQWLTASSWQDHYGILPLLVGSLLISLVALVIAVPLGVGAGRLHQPDRDAVGAGHRQARDRIHLRHPVGRARLLRRRDPG